MKNSKYWVALFLFLVSSSALAERFTTEDVNKMAENAVQLEKELLRDQALQNKLPEGDQSSLLATLQIVARIKNNAIQLKGTGREYYEDHPEVKKLKSYIDMLLLRTYFKEKLAPEFRTKFLESAQKFISQKKEIPLPAVAVPSEIKVKPQSTIVQVIHQLVLLKEQLEERRKENKRLDELDPDLNVAIAHVEKAKNVASNLNTFVIGGNGYSIREDDSNLLEMNKNIEQLRQTLYFKDHIALGLKIDLETALNSFRDSVTKLPVKANPPIKPVISSQPYPRFINGKVVKTAPLISREQCNEIAFDNRNLMGADTDQKQSPFCSGHAAAALLEEQLCLASPKDCKKVVARTEVMAKAEPNEYALAQVDGIKVRKALEYFIGKKGGYQVCLDKYAKNPFDEHGAVFLTNLKTLYKTIHVEACGNPATACAQEEIPEKIQSQIDTSFGQIIKLMDQDQSMWSVAAGMPAESFKLTREKYEKILLRSKNANEFIQNVLLSYCDAGMKKSFKRDGVDLTVKMTEFDPQPEKKGMIDPKTLDPSPFLDIFKDAKNFGHSTALGVCYNKMSVAIKNSGLSPGKAAFEIDSKDSCGRHSVVIPAVEWSHKINSCIFYVKNSHGIKATLKSRFYPAEMILPHVYRATYFGIKK